MINTTLSTSGQESAEIHLHDATVGIWSAVLSSWGSNTVNLHYRPSRGAPAAAYGGVSQLASNVPQRVYLQPGYYKAVKGGANSATPVKLSLIDPEARWEVAV